MSTPLLTIGIIFKDNIRSIERCLSALQPLRDSVPCELILADTGSTDGSREVAEKYADVLFDFPWINDFSAARNAVVDRASGEWFFTVDTDEYLDEDVAGLTDCLKAPPQGYDAFAVTVRNYFSYDMGDDYTDFTAVRLLRMSTGARYQGRIHEAWRMPAGPLSVYAHPCAVLHHDGYVELEGPASEKKKRNLNLLREKVKEEPENLMGWLQLIESGKDEPDFWDIMGEAAALVEAKKPEWEQVGPPILRYGVLFSIGQKRPEANEWIERAETMFPDSLFTRIDVQGVVVLRLWEAEDYAGCITRAEDYLRAMEDFWAHKDPFSHLISTFQMSRPVRERRIRLYLADACSKEGQPERALELLEGIELEKLDAGQLEQFMIALREVHRKSFLDTAPLLTAVWEHINSAESSRERRGAFLRPCGAAFARENREKERLSSRFCRSAYTMLLPLEGKCELGCAAAVLAEDNPQKMEQILAGIENWNEFPIHALAYALECGAEFPSPRKPLNMEEMDTLISRVAKDKSWLLPAAIKAAEGDFARTLQRLYWTRGLVLSALRANDWAPDKIPEGSVLTLSMNEPEEQKEDCVERSLAIARAFARLEEKYLPIYYAPGLLNKDALFMLPPLHRFGWYCVQAFQALERGDQASYVRLLREGLAVCESAKDIVEFLIEHIPEVQPQEPSAAMATLAEQIRTTLARFAPDDPAVAALKQSEAYRKVAHLIEGIEPPVVGGLLQ